VKKKIKNIEKMFSSELREAQSYLFGLHMLFNSLYFSLSLSILFFCYCVLQSWSNV